MSVDYDVAIVVIGFVVSILAERLPGLAPYWHALSAGRKRAYVALAAVIVGAAAALIDGQPIAADTLTDAVRYAALALGGSIGGHNLGKVDDA